MRLVDARGELHGPGRWLLGGVQVLCGLLGSLLLLTAVGALLWPRDPNIVFERGPVWWGFLLSLGAVLGFAVAGRGLHGLAGRLGGRRWAGAASWVTGLVLSVAGALGGVWLASQVRYQYGWDASILTMLAKRLDTGEGLGPYGIDYLSRYPNNIPMLAVDLGYRRLAVAWDTDPYTVATTVNGIGLFLTLVAVFAVLRRLRGTGSAVLGVLLVFVLLGASPWMAVPYTDLLAAPLVAGAVALGVEAVHRRHLPVRVSLLAGAGALLGAGYAVKTTPATTAVALLVVAPALVLAGVAARTSRLRRVAAGVVAVVAVVGPFAGASHLVDSWATTQTGTASLDTTKSPPLAWWAAMGLSTTRAATDNPYYGGYDGTMVRESRNLSGPALEQYSQEQLSARLEAMGAGGVTAFEVDKQLFNWGDGMFFAWGEGFDSEPSVLRVHDATARSVQSWAHASGADYPVRAALVDGLWLCVLALAGAGLLVLSARPRWLGARAPEVTLVALGVLGILTFTLVFQGRSRYLLAFVPLVVVLALAVTGGRRDAGPAGGTAGASPDAARAELDGDPGADGLAGLGDAVVPGPLAGATHDHKVPVPQREADGGPASSRPQHQ